jgi:N-acetylmuramoyl-L-alanine amidase
LNEGQGSKKSQQIMEAFNAQPSESMREQSKSFAQDILNDLNGNYRLHNTRPTSEALVILRSPWSRSILLELGFLSNPDEAKKLADSEYIMKLASDLAQSIERYILKNEGIIKIGYVD